MSKRSRAQLLIGGNLGDRVKNLELAEMHIEDRIGKMTYSSAIYESEPWGFEDEHSFLNRLIIVETSLPPTELMEEIKSIEADMGRTQSNTQWSSRIIDIDILFYEEMVIEESHLTIPHPRIGERRFVLEPLLESNPAFIHPLTKKSVQELHEECTDNSEVILYDR